MQRSNDKQYFPPLFDVWCC